MALSTPLRVALASAAIGAVGFLVFSDTGEGVLEYVYVEQVAADPDHFVGREIKVHGNAVPGTVQQAKNGDYRFVIEHEGQKLHVHFTNMLPDTFVDGGEVVLTGKLNHSGDVLESSDMTAKCPSKYESEPDALDGDRKPPNP